MTDTAPLPNARGTYINPGVPTVEATDANGVPLTAFVTLLDGNAPDGPHLLTTLFLNDGHAGASMDSTLLPNRAACVEAGAGQLRVILLSMPQSKDEGIEKGGGYLAADMLDVAAFRHWTSVICQPLTQVD